VRGLRRHLANRDVRGVFHDAKRFPSTFASVVAGVLTPVPTERSGRRARMRGKASDTRGTGASSEANVVAAE
jgi:hypothetical protein